MKFLFSPVGLIVILVLLVIVFMPRRAPDKVAKFGKPMKAFPDDERPVTSATATSRDSAADAPGSSAEDASPPS